VPIVKEVRNTNAGVKVNASMPKKKTKRESDKELLANVTREMAEPRVAESARTEACEQDRIVDSK
jgi:hypothetical protein